MASKVETKELTALDLIKGLSMFVMMTDHVGYYFFPQDLWFRSFGRIDFPVWFFLPGYSRSRAFEKSWLVGGLILLAGNILAGFSLLPVNAIFTIMLIRFSVDRIALYMISDRIRFWVAAVLMAALFPVTRLFFEYGSLALIIGVFGWLCRNKGERPDGDRLARQFGVFSWLAFSILQQYMFRFDVPQFLLMSLGTGMYFVILYFYRPKTFPQAASVAAGIPAAIVRFLGRYTLEIYVFHLLLFKAVHLWLHPEYFMKWHVFVGEAMHAQI
ncbi:MAG: hypothetical protein EPN97_13895 [Alphaproteobacteria bacterium]|nr:MAG: hypothetical protein EPN97_13895 [Alphaproteobacteria bacterium]